MVTVRFVTIDPCTHATCTVCAQAEEALRKAMDTLGEAVPGGPAGPTWRALGLVEGHVTMAHLQPGEAGLDEASAPYLVLDDQVLMHGDEWDDEAAALLIAKALYPSGWT